MGKRVIKTQKAPLPVGAYSQAVMVNGLIFVSGQLPVEPESGNFIRNDIKKATEQIIKNISAILDEVDTSLQNVVKVNIYLKDINKFKDVNEVYSRFFNADPPARAVVAVKDLPLDSDIEIECIAITEKS